MAAEGRAVTGEEAVTGDFVVTGAELRAVARFAVRCAEPLLPHFERAAPGDPRPARALAAARLFAGGAARSNLQRTAAVDAHRAAKEVPGEVASLAALACGDAAAAAYLHPLARATQVGHILRAASCAARVTELTSGATEEEAVTTIAALAEPAVSDVLRRYPAAPPGRSPLARVMRALDTGLRLGGGGEPDV